MRFIEASRCGDVPTDFRNDNNAATPSELELVSDEDDDDSDAVNERRFLDIGALSDATDDTSSY